MFKRAYIEITNICNLNCSFCHGTKRAKRFMSPEEFARIAGKLRPYTDYIYLHVMGEPLLHPQLQKILDIATDLGFRINITTNGTLLDRQMDLLLGYSSIRKVSVSLHSFEGNGRRVVAGDACGDERDEKVADEACDDPESDDRRECEGLHGSERDERREREGLHGSERDERRECEAWHDSEVKEKCGTDGLIEYLDNVWNFAAQAPYIVALRLWNEGENGLNTYNTEIIRYLEEKTGLDIMSIPCDVINGRKLRERLYLESADRFEWPDISATATDTSFCYALSTQIAVLVDGTVVPCCLDSEGTIALGNLLGSGTETEVQEILNSPRALAIREGFASRCPSEELCRHCEYASRF